MDTTENGWKAFGGYRFSPYLGVEANCVDLGMVTSVINASVLNPAQRVTDVSRAHPYSITGASLVGIASLPVGVFSVIAKAGPPRWDARAQARVVPAGTPFDEVDDKSTSAAFGFGASHDVPNSRWTVCGEWKRFRTIRNRPEFLSLSVLYRF